MFYQVWKALPGKERQLYVPTGGAFIPSELLNKRDIYESLIFERPDAICIAQEKLEESPGNIISVSTIAFIGTEQQRIFA